jgi:hypothetical protein
MVCSGEMKGKPKLKLHRLIQSLNHMMIHLHLINFWFQILMMRILQNLHEF